MMWTQYVIGVPFIAGIGITMLTGITAVVAPKSGIEVHSLTFTNDPMPSIVQDRTVHANEKMVAIWTASITAGGARQCDGNGSWKYSAGHASPSIPLNEWVGDEGCWDKLPAGVPLQACAKYEWGDGQETNACTLSFRKVEGNE